MQFIWHDEKNEALALSRGITFERIVVAIGEGRLLSVLQHPNHERYSDQHILVVEVDEYAFCVPFVHTPEGDLFLKTIFPSRKFTKIHLKHDDPDE